MYAEAENSRMMKDDPFLSFYFDLPALKAYADEYMRVQDEYLEWFAHHDK